MKTISEIKKDFENGKYKPSFPYPVKKAFVENEDETIRQNRERKILFDKEYKESVSKYEDAQRVLSEKLQNDCIEVEIGYGLSRKQVELILSNAYQEKHSYMSEVFYYFESQCELVRSVLDVKPEEIKEKEKEKEKAKPPVRDHSCTYSKAMNEPRPRRCIYCGKTELEEEEITHDKC